MASVRGKLSCCRESKQLDSHQAACVGCPISSSLAMEGAQGSGRVGDESMRDRPSNPAPKRGGVMKGIFKFCCFCCASA